MFVSVSSPATKPRYQGSTNTVVKIIPILDPYFLAEESLAERHVKHLIVALRQGSASKTVGSIQSSCGVSSCRIYDMINTPSIDTEK